MNVGRPYEEPSIHHLLSPRYFEEWAEMTGKWLQDNRDLWCSESSKRPHNCFYDYEYACSNYFGPFHRYCLKLRYSLLSGQYHERFHTKANQNNKPTWTFSRLFALFMMAEFVPVKATQHSLRIEFYEILDLTSRSFEVASIKVFSSYSCAPNPATPKVWKRH